MAWKYSHYDNDTGPDDDYFEEWWEVCDESDNAVARALKSEGDAHLIASAPDLLDALMALSDVVCDLRLDVSGHALDAINKADAAIAKAEGRS